MSYYSDDNSVISSYRHLVHAMVFYIFSISYKVLCLFKEDVLYYNLSKESS